MVSGRLEVAGALRLKSLLPVMPREVMVAEVLPVLVSTTDRVLFAPTVTLPKASVVRLGVSETAAPVPVRPTVVVLPATPPVLEVMVRVSVLSPAETGANCTSTWALPPGRMLLTEGRTVKPAAPGAITLAMSNLAVPVLLMVKIWVALLPRPTVPKPMLAGLTWMVGTAMPVAVNAMVVTAAPLLVITRLLAAATPLADGA